MKEFIISRLIIFIPTLFVVSIVVFIIINAPPGDYLTTLEMQLKTQGDAAAEYMLNNYRQRYGIGQPLYIKYWKWIKNFVRGDLGESFEWQEPVARVIGDRIFLTVVLSLSTMLFTWIVAIPIGIYSATHQYSFGDRFFTVFGFIGLATPNFLLALVALYISAVHLNLTSVGGLFSPVYRDAPWSLGKFIDLLSHMWVPVLIVGTYQLASLIRIMRSNMLDILGQPFVTTARAKGLSNKMVIYKHSLRVAINPLISMMGTQLPKLVSGTMIVALVLNIPTVGPLLYRALISQDVYLSGSFLMIVTFLLLIGNLLADVLLALSDPRIRYN